MCFQAAFDVFELGPELFEGRFVIVICAQLGDPIPYVVLTGAQLVAFGERVVGERDEQVLDLCKFAEGDLEFNDVGSAGCLSWHICG